MLRRHLLAGAGGLLAAGRARAQSTVPVEMRMIIPFAAGGATDLLARRLQPLLEARGHRLVIENATGGGTVVGMARLAQSRADGTVLGLASSGLLAQMATGEVPLRPEQFMPLVRVAEDPTILIVGHNSPLHSMQDVIAAIRQPRGVTAGSAGARGTMGHLRLAAMASELGGSIEYVGYPGAARMTNELLGGHLDMGVAKPNDIFGQVRSGQIRVLAVFDTQRLRQLPEVPTVGEAGITVHPYGRMIQMTYLVAPAGLPEAMKRPIVALYREAILSPDYQAKAEEDCYIADGLAGDELNAVLNETMQAFKAAQARVQG